jgi:hypothetical protein
MALSEEPQSALQAALTATAIKQLPGFRETVKACTIAISEGRVQLWEEVERELSIG